LRARGFNKRIDIYQTTKVSDSFGGYTNDASLLASVWANISTINVSKGSSNITAFGVIDVNNSVIVTIRKRAIDIETMYIMYRGFKYTISSSPVNPNFEDSILQFIATKESLKDA